MGAHALALIADYHPERVFAWHDGTPVTCASALCDIQAVARELTGDSAYINGCSDRYLFTVTLAAVALAGSVNLLPQSNNESALASVRARFSNAPLIDDDVVRRWLYETSVAPPPSTSPELPAGQRIAVVFTSGSTGEPTAHDKFWGDLDIVSRLYAARFFPGGQRPNTVATVPPQHMYGLETSVLPALHIGFAAHTQQPFTPWAVAAALVQLPEPRLLITTPVHLRACLDAGTAMPAVERVISAAAPLATSLARAVEDAWHTQVHEIYGSTETGSVASRRTSETEIWTLYDGMALSCDNGFWLSGEQLPEPFRLGDELVLLDDHRFELLGRAADMLKVAGKRLSINALTQQLLAIDGVVDAVAFVPPGEADIQRPAALVVAPDISEREIAARLSEKVDDVFVPRPLLRVDALPRNRLGKIPRGDLLSALAAARQKARQHVRT